MLVELMVALALGLAVVLAASTAFLAGKKLFDASVDVQQAQDTMRYARYVVQNVVRQTGYVDYAREGGLDGVDPAAPPRTSVDPPVRLIAGATNTTVRGSDDGVGVHGSDLRGGNDSLMVRFFGRNARDSGEADGTMIDCLGQPVGWPPATGPAAQRAWSFFYVAVADDGEPELYCKRFAPDDKGAGTFHTQPIARGVEKFKVVFGHDADGDGVPERWLDAQGVQARAEAAGVPAATAWHQVVAVRVGMVVRSARPQADLKGRGAPARLLPLGADFERTASFTPPDDGRVRLTTTFTLMLRNVVRAAP